MMLEERLRVICSFQMCLSPESFVTLDRLLFVKSIRPYSVVPSSCVPGTKETAQADDDEK